MNTPTWYEEGECGCGCAPLDETYAATTRAIEDPGWMVIAVDGGDGRHVPWAYTIGLIERFAHPEFIVTGLGALTAHTVVNAFGLEVKAGRRFDGVGISEEVQNILTVPARLMPVHRSHWAGDRFNQWHGYYEDVGGKPDDPEAIQIVWPAVDGAFPSDPGEEHAQVHQPLLHRPPVTAN